MLGKSFEWITSRVVSMAGIIVTAITLFTVNRNRVVIASDTIFRMSPIIYGDGHTLAAIRDFDLASMTTFRFAICDG